MVKKYLISFEGKTVDELEEGFKYMVDEHIKDCKINHLPLKKPYKGNLNIRLAPELHKKAAHNAALKGISLNQYINEAIRKELHVSESDPEKDYTQEKIILKKSKNFPACQTQSMPRSP